ncbi:hypothetical protein [Actinocrispum sp. NPDC049592]|uniref:hypothetical protein n=1 Tax=Actinocrispum sp. NPDC049592 TaxID=3154835 RepID=UPI0034256B91
MNRLWASAAWLVAAGLAIAGSLVTINSYRTPYETLTSSTWTMKITPAVDHLTQPWQGFGLAVAAGLLAVAAAVRLSRTRQPLSRLVGIYGTGVLCAVTVGVLDWFRILMPNDRLPPGFVAESGPAMWFLVAASALAIAAVGLSLVPRTEQSG